MSESGVDSEFTNDNHAKIHDDHAKIHIEYIINNYGSISNYAKAMEDKNMIFYEALKGLTRKILFGDDEEVVNE